MRSFLTWVSRALAVFFAVTVVITIPLTLAGFQAGKVIFNPELMKAVSMEGITEGDLLPRVVDDVMQRWIEGEEGEMDDDPALKELFLRLDRAEWERVTAILLPDEVLAEFTANVVDGLYTWLDSPDPLPAITLDLSLVRARLTGPPGASLAQIFFASLPPCGSEEVEAFIRDPSLFQSPSEVFELSCKMPELPRKQQIEVYKLVLAHLVAEIPSRVQVAEEFGSEEVDSEENIATLKHLLRIIRWGAQWSWVVPLICLFLVALFGVRSIGGLGGWWGIPITIGSAFSFGATFFLPSTLIRLFADRVASRFPAYLERAGLEVLLRLTREIFRPLRRQSLLGMILGLLLVSLLVIWDWRRRNSPSTGTGMERIL